MDAVNKILAEAIARSSRLTFYTADPAAVADDDALALAAMKTAAATDDDHRSLRKFSRLVDSAAGNAIYRLVHNPIHQGAAPHAPLDCLAMVRRVAFLLRCLREVYEPWFLRVLQATDFFRGPLRALEAKIPETINSNEYLGYESMIESMLTDPNRVDIQHICDARDQLVAMQSKLSTVVRTRARTWPLDDALHFVTRTLGEVDWVLEIARERMRESAHGTLIRFRNESELLVEDSGGHFTFTAVRQLATLLAQQSKPNPFSSAPSTPTAEEGELGTLEERIRAMLAEIDGLIADPLLDEDDPRRFRWMAAAVLLEYLLLRIEDALQQREVEYAVPRRLAFAQSLAPHAAPRPPITALSDELVRKIAGMSLEGDPPGWRSQR